MNKTQEIQSFLAPILEVKPDAESALNELACDIAAAYENFTVEIIGSWYWISGPKGNFTESVRAKLKEVGFFFSAQKKAWFWNGQDRKRRGFCKSIEKVKEYHEWVTLN